MKISFSELKAILDSETDAVVVFGNDEQPIFWNQTYLDLWSLSDEQIRRHNQQTLTALVTSQLEVTGSLDEDPNSLFGRQESRIDFKSNQHKQRLRRTEMPLMIAGERKGCIVRWQDITDLSKINAELAFEHNLLLTLVNTVPDQIYFKDTESRFIRINPSLARRYRIAKPEYAIGKSDADFYSAEHAAQTRKEELAIMQSGEAIYDQLHHETWSDGTESWNLSTKIPMYNSEGKLVGLVGISHDITEHKQREATIWQQANFDSLTGLANRRRFADQFEDQIGHLYRTGRNLALLMLDLDNFKDINDTFGHATGDQLLQAVAQRLRGAVRKTDLIARLGGDEFAIIVSDLSSKSAITPAVEKLMSVFEQPIVINNEQLNVSASIGVAIAPDDSDSYEDLMRFADQAMYQAKHLGRNRYSIYTAELAQEKSRRLRLAADLQKALDANQLCLYYQPVINLQSGQIESAEVLSRWQHDELGSISPEEFIPLAEHNGLIATLDQAVISRARSQLAHWHQQGFAELKLSINLSPANIAGLAALNFPLDQILSETTLPDGAICLEITEGVLLEPSAQTDHFLRALQQSGCELAIDDFGTGYSALSYLLHFNIQRVKIDKLFVGRLPDDPKSQTLCKAVIELAHALGIKVTAEGIETPEQLTMLTDLGCDSGQGFLLGRPMPAEQFYQTLKQHSCGDPGEQ